LSSLKLAGPSINRAFFAATVVSLPLLLTAATAELSFRLWVQTLAYCAVGHSVTARAALSSRQERAGA
jgi:hypothetical protein